MPKVNARLPVLVGTIEKQIKDYKILFIGAMFPEKIQFDGKKYRTNTYNKVLKWIFQNTNELEKEKPEDRGDLPHSSVSVPGAGTEPASYRLHILISCSKKKAKESSPFALLFCTRSRTVFRTIFEGYRFDLAG